MNFQILDADYVTEGNSPVVRLFGRDAEGKSVCCYVPGFEPYFYVNASGELDLICKLIKERFDVVKSVDIVQRFEPVGYQKSRKPMIMVTTYEPRHVPEIRDDILQIPGVKEVYETDILFRNRFLIDRGLHGMGWVSVSSSEEGILAGKVYCDTVCSDPHPAEMDILPNAPLKFLSFDIECLPLGGSMPSPDESPVIMISLTFAPSYKGHNTIVLVAKHVSGAGQDVESLKDEESMFKRFFEILREYDPDILVGYNINDFDIPYITDRVKFLSDSGTMVDSGSGRDGRPMNYRKIGTMTLISMTGRVVVDVLPLIRSQFSLKRYTLRNVAKELLDREKLDVAPSEMEDYWKDEGEKLLKFIDYARRDSELAMELVMKLQLLDRYIAISRVSGSLLQEVIDGGQTSMVENLLLRECRIRDRVIPPKPNDDLVYSRNKNSEGLKGGEVLEPKKGLLENVVILDYKSLYPTIMMAHNLCYTTVVEKDVPEEEGKTITPPSGGKFVTADVSKGIMPTILENLLNRRIETKKRMKGISNEDEYRALDATQLAMKILLNSFYGYAGYTRARLYSLTLANAVTSFGRENIIKTRSLIENIIHTIYLKDGNSYLKSEINLDLQIKSISLSVVYGDTDSVFVQCTAISEISLEDAELVGKKISGIVSASLPDPMELEFESIAKRALFIAKKRYAIWVFERSADGWKDGIKVKGMETVRRDWCELTSKTLNRVLELVLKEGEVEAAVRHVRKVVDSIRNLDVTKDKDIIDDLTMTRMYSKKREHYKNKQPHLTVAEKMEKRTGSPPPVGERIPFVITAGKDLFVNRAEDPEYVRENNVSLDVDYYVKKQILPPVERILGVFGVDLVNLDYDSKQTGLSDFTSGSPEKKIRRSVPKKQESDGAAPSTGSQRSLFDF
ncbi:MAG: DNA-directed DNA polymerase [Methanomethylovorans sp.]|uniref:DNA-directed DNA polymerase n=1 Tax=Methanomethylovorans sp. TaxID=2758717 RepID=UPI003530EB62